MIHLIYASCYVRDTRCSRHLNFAIFLYHKIRQINVIYQIFNKVFVKSSEYFFKRVNCEEDLRYRIE